MTKKIESENRFKITDRSYLEKMFKKTLLKQYTKCDLFIIALLNNYHYYRTGDHSVRKKLLGQNP